MHLCSFFAIEVMEYVYTYYRKLCCVKPEIFLLLCCFEVLYCDAFDQCRLLSGFGIPTGSRYLVTEMPVALLFDAVSVSGSLCNCANHWQTLDHLQSMCVWLSL